MPCLLNNYYLAWAAIEIEEIHRWALILPFYHYMTKIQVEHVVRQDEVTFLDILHFITSHFNSPVGIYLDVSFKAVQAGKSLYRGKVTTACAIVNQF